MLTRLSAPRLRCTLQGVPRVGVRTSRLPVVHPAGRVGTPRLRLLAVTCRPRKGPALPAPPRPPERGTNRAPPAAPPTLHRAAARRRPLAARPGEARGAHRSPSGAAPASAAATVGPSGAPGQPLPRCQGFPAFIETAVKASTT